MFSYNFSENFIETGFFKSHRRKNIIIIYTWEPYGFLKKEYLIANGLYDHNWKGVRCPRCDKPFENERGVKSHMQHCYYNQTCNQEIKQDFKNRKAEQAAYKQKLIEAQKLRPKVTCEGKKLKNIFIFKYLGSLFAANGDQSHDLSRRIALAMSRYGQLRHVIGSPDVPLAVKLSIYKTAVTSLLTWAM